MCEGPGAPIFCGWISLDWLPEPHDGRNVKAHAGSVGLRKDCAVGLSAAEVGAFAGVDADDFAFVDEGWDLND